MYVTFTLHVLSVTRTPPRAGNPRPQNRSAKLDVLGTESKNTVEPFYMFTFWILFGSFKKKLNPVEADVKKRYWYSMVTDRTCNVHVKYMYIMYM